MRRALLTDWDGTLQRGFVHLDWARFLAEQRAFDPAEVTTMEQAFKRYHSQPMPYDELAVEVLTAYARGLSGVAVDKTVALAGQFVDARDDLWPFVPNLLAYLKERQIAVVVISGAPRVILDRYQERLGLTEVVAVEVGIAGGHWTGELLSNPATSESKRRGAAEIARRYRIVLAMGDSSADLPLFEVAPAGLLVRDPRPGRGAHAIEAPGTVGEAAPEHVLEAVRSMLEQ